MVGRHMIGNMSPEDLAFKHHFLPMEVTAVYADPDNQCRYDLARLELEGFPK
jgi:hypothetical protein